MRKIFWLYLIVVGLVMVWLIPPFQKADEVIHFQFAAAIVGGKPWQVQKRFVELPVRLNAIKIAHQYEIKFDDRRVWEKDENKELVGSDYYSNWKSHISYFPVEIGVWAGSFSSYPAMSLYGGRMAGLILFLICIWLSLRIIPKDYSNLVVAYAIVPMVIHQATEISYDVFLLCLAPLILAVFLRVLWLKNFWKWLVLLVVLILLFVLVKSGYYLMVGLIPIALWVKFKDLMISKPWIVSIVMLACVPGIIFFVRFLGNNVESDWGLINGGYQLEIIKHDPWWVLRIIEDTWVAKRDFYFRGMMGYFGWLDYEFDLYQYFIIIGTLLALMALTVSKIKRPKTDWLGWVMIGGIILGTYVLIEMGFLMQWTAVGSSVVEGVQGRYLLPVLPLVLLWISQFWVLAGKKRANIIVFGLVMVILAFGIVDKINKRYSDFSTNFKNKDELQKPMKTPTYLSSKDKFTKIFHTSEGDVVGGFEMVINKKDNDLIRIPYRYSLKDSECKQEMAWGYLNSDKIKSSSVYQQRFDEIAIGLNDICLEIEPLVTSDKEKYFGYVESEGELLVRLLFVSDEVN